MTTISAIPQPSSAGSRASHRQVCQSRATCDLVVASTEATFARGVSQSDFW